MPAEIAKNMYEFMRDNREMIARHPEMLDEYPLLQGAQGKDLAWFESQMGLKK